MLRGQRDPFAFGAVSSAFVALALLNSVNPDELIVRTNAGRANAVEPLDERYVTSLSADAVPALIEVLDQIPEGKRPAVAEALLDCWSPQSEGGWRNWSWARALAWQAVSANSSRLDNLARLRPAEPNVRASARCGRPR